MKSWIFILFIFFLGSCKARCRKESDIKRTYVNQDLKDFFIFKKGTYWVYENQDKTKTDSIYVSDYQSTWTPIDRILCSQDENIVYTWKSTGKHFFQTDSVNFQASYFTTATRVYDSELIFDGINFFSIDKNQPYMNGDGYKKTDKPVIKNLDLKINGRQYNGEYFNYTNPGRTDLFLKKDIGILGWVVESDTFNLKNH